MGGCPVPFVASGSQEPDDPVPPIDRPEPVSASTFLLFGQRFFQVLFDQTLISMPSASVGNWFPVWQNFSYLPTAVSIFGNRVQVRAGSGIFVGGPDRITYFATPEDVRAQDDGAPALPFSDFPLT